jgi:hypothetical protein
MIDRVDKRLVFKPLNNRPFLNGETEPCINGRILHWKVQSSSECGRLRSLTMVAE